MVKTRKQSREQIHSTIFEAATSSINLKTFKSSDTIECFKLESDVLPDTSRNLELAPAYNVENLEAIVVTTSKRLKKGRITVEDIESLARVSEAPPEFSEVYSAIREMRKERDAPVDIFGCHMVSPEIKEPKSQRFCTLVAVFLSSQTADAVTAACVKRLLKRGLNPESIARETEDELAALIKPVSFHKTKAKNLIKISNILLEQYDGDIPSTFEDLCKLPGVGAKMALITMSSAWGKVEGIAVDVHVHRICNRLGWVKTKTPEETCLQLARKIPKNLWNEFNVLLVGFGQQRCKAQNPQLLQGAHTDRMKWHKEQTKRNLRGCTSLYD